jgi:3',5'-cyclic-AMP phosphodiesterase
MKKNTVRFIHISDTHIGESKDFTLYGKNTFNCTKKLLDLIEKFNSPFDFIIHTGDIINTPQKNAISLARELFSTIGNPIYFITGNHDNTDVIKQIQNPDIIYSQRSNILNAFSLDKFMFLSLNLKGMGKDNNHGLFSSEDSDALKCFLRNHIDYEIIIFIHFPPLKIDCPWIDKEMTLLNNELFLEILYQFTANIRGVFYGHIHNHSIINHNGIIYSSAPSPFCQFRILASDKKVQFEPEIPVSFNYITIDKNDLIIKTISETDIKN